VTSKDRLKAELQTENQFLASFLPFLECYGKRFDLNLRWLAAQEKGLPSRQP
jgi:hypothetical protein